MTKDGFTERYLEVKLVGTQLVENQRRYLMMRHLGMRDDEMLIDPEHGVIYTEASLGRIKHKLGTACAPDVEYWTCYDVVNGKLVSATLDETRRG